MPNRQPTAQPADPALRTLSDLHTDTEAVVALANTTRSPVIITRQGRFIARIDGIDGLDIEELAGLGIFTDTDLAALAAHLDDTED